MRCQSCEAGGAGWRRVLVEDRGGKPRWRWTALCQACQVQATRATEEEVAAANRAAERDHGMRL